MRILYGVQGTGNGHLSRSRDIVRALKSLGHDIRVVVSGRERSKLWEMEVFEPFQVLRGLTFVTIRGMIRRWATWKQLRLWRFFRDVRALDCRGFDLAITDYEPITARAARRARIPVLGLGHQYAFFHPVPMARTDPLSRLIMRHFAPVDIPVGLHWHHFNRAILPPVVPSDLATGPHSDSNKVVVYLPFESLEAVQELLHGFPRIQFYVYGLRPEPEDRGHLHFRAPSRAGFLHDVKTSAGVVANAGFTLSSECLHMGKKVIVKPVGGQIEQAANAVALEALGLGASMTELSRKRLGQWLEQPAIPPQSYPDVAKEVAQWISQYPNADLNDLVKTLWADVPLPPWPPS